MAQHKMIGIMIMNPDDYRYFFSEVRSQPRAIIPASGYERLTRITSGAMTSCMSEPMTEGPFDY